MLVCFLGGAASMRAGQSAPKAPQGEKPMRLGNFSVSLTVKDLKASRAFYEKLGFHPKGDHGGPNWIVLQNDTATIGLFQGMFDKNILTFNPGWDRDAKPLSDFDDVRDLQKRFVAAGLELTVKADEASTGPASLMLADPDGNPILIDQFVDKPSK
jgi:catechol 2,3-dioxygenase-like lactoylglutathione lyase family enzyme